MWKVHREKKKIKISASYCEKVTFDSCTSNYSWHLGAHSWDHHTADKSNCAGASLTPGPRHPFCQPTPPPLSLKPQGKRKKPTKTILIYGQIAVRIVNWKMPCQIILKHKHGGKGRSKPSCCAVVSASSSHKTTQLSDLQGRCPHRHKNSLV